MGLCKCPKKKVTNLFCFEHRVNVCEYCLIENHPRCIVQSYLNWLKDSDYVPNCGLCSVSLTEGDVIRLLCYDVFHISCLAKYYRSLPSNTAPAGYRCDSCDSPVFPAPNQAGYVVEHLREVLSKYNWARVGLCLPLIDEPPPVTTIDDESSTLIEDHDNDSLHGMTVPPPVVTSSETFTSNDDSVLSLPTNLNNTYQSKNDYWQPPVTNTRTQQRQAETVSKSTILSMDEIQQGSNGEDFKPVPRKLLGGAGMVPLKGISLGDDPDGPDKYKRRSAWSWLKRWLKSRMLRGRGYHDKRALPRRTAILLLIGLIALLTFIVFATKVGHRPDNNDPNFDPLLNPNIHIAHQRAVEVINDVVDKDLLDPLQAIQPAAGGR